MEQDCVYPYGDGTTNEEHDRCVRNLEEDFALSFDYEKMFAELKEDERDELCYLYPQLDDEADRREFIATTPDIFDIYLSFLEIYKENILDYIEYEEVSS